MARGADRLVFLVARVPHRKEPVPALRHRVRSRALRGAARRPARPLAHPHDAADRGRGPAGAAELGRARGRNARARPEGRSRRLDRDVHLQLVEVLRRVPSVSIAQTGAIDVHTHIFPAGWDDFAARYGGDKWPRLVGDPTGPCKLYIGQTFNRNLTPHSFHPVKRIEDMDRTGIALQALSPGPPTFCYWADCL